MPGQHDAMFPGSALRILHLRCPADVDPQVYRLLLGLVAEVTPVVQALPPSALVADVSGSLRYFGRDLSGLARMIRTRALARYGLDVKIGVASTWALAAMASTGTGPGGIRTVGAARAEMEAFLYPRPVGELYGIGPAQARTLTTFGVHSVGIPRRAPGVDRPAHPWRAYMTTDPRTRQGHRPEGRRPHPPPLPYSTSAQRRFPIDTLDPAAVRAALLSLAVELGDRLRNRQQAARTVTLTVTLAGRSQITRSHRLDGGPSAHTDDLRQTLYDLYADCGFQRARIRAVTARCEQLQDAARTPEQLSLEPQRDDQLRAETAIDALNRRFGAGTVGPAAAYGRAV
ncbi:DinB/UmuC family translesion DNA polymerase [Streptomyces microflavus]|uniref:DinB/UmuC family translesion DNA polymerase n=1 Tax=Streptomyces microflavus TaxID=1919 RepID=UPI0033E49EB4